MSFNSMASKLVFSPSEDEILLQEIQKNPILFDLSDANYKNIVLKDRIWKEISLKIGKSVDDTKKRWKNIRDSYSRNKRKLGTGLLEKGRFSQKSCHFSIIFRWIMLKDSNEDNEFI
ncbi:hypothetical protein QTP88_010176 [Uroleucon formosanum]